MGDLYTNEWELEVQTTNIAVAVTEMVLPVSALHEAH